MPALSPSAQLVAGLVLAALPHLVQHGLVAPNASEVITSFGVSRTSAYKARSAIAEALPNLLRPPGRPAGVESEPLGDMREMHEKVLCFLMDHPGSVTGSTLRRTYADVYRLFVLELVSDQPECSLEVLGKVVQVPLATLKDWLRGERPQVGTSRINMYEGISPGPTVAHVESVLLAWGEWQGRFRPFCEHVQLHLRLPLSRQHICDILHAHGVRIPKTRRRPPDDSTLRGGTEIFFPGAQWVGDGMELSVEVDGVVYFANLELNVDLASGALVGASIRPTEDSEAVIEAMKDGATTTGAPPLALLLDNKPSNHSAEVEAALEDTVKLRARPYTPTDKAHVEGVFGLFSQEAPALKVNTEPSVLAAQVAALVFMTWARAVNHRARPDRNGASRVSLYNEARPTPEEIMAARERFAERLIAQERARETRQRREDPVVRGALDDAFERLALSDEDGRLRRAIACWPLDAVLAGISIFEGKKRRGTLPSNVDGRYLRGIVVNLATEAESMAIADALLDERIRAQDRSLRGLELARQGFEEVHGEDPAWLVKDYVGRATGARRTLDRYWWLRAAADVVLEVVDERRSLLRLAARHISATHKLSYKERNAAIRFLYAKAVPVA